MLFEIKAIRDYFVDEAVLPRSVGADPKFLNLYTFVNKFYPNHLAKYSTEAIIGVKKTLQTPAISHFLRSKFIIAE